MILTKNINQEKTTYNLPLYYLNRDFFPYIYVYIEKYILNFLAGNNQFRDEKKLCCKKITYSTINIEISICNTEK